MRFVRIMRSVMSQGGCLSKARDCSPPSKPLREGYALVPRERPVMPVTLSPQEFVNKWRKSMLKERAAAQKQIDDLARQVQSIGRYMHDHSIKIGYRRVD